MNLSKILFFIIIFIATGCSLKWTEALQLGSIGNKEFRELVSVEINHGLIIIPVSIHGTTYRFLFDSGAPLSISSTLQEQLKLKIISNGHIIDSDHNRKKVFYVSVDSLLLGDALFTDQTAFVTEFDSNPFIKCLDIDGIIGSNLMRHCNWVIDMQHEKITISDLPIIDDIHAEYSSVPFQTDNQFNILTSLRIGKSTIKNVTVDYGSNGSLSLPSNIFKSLKEKDEIGKTFRETGHAQSGLIGKSIKIDREISFLDSMEIGDLAVKNVALKSSKSALLGSKILSKYQVTIDWESQKLIFKEQELFIEDHATFGFHVGYTHNKNLYIQSVIENSPASHSGIKPDMQVLQIDSLDFTNNHGLCDYMKYVNEETSDLTLQLKTSDGQFQTFRLEKKALE